ncbi:MAG: hypothetical protein A6F71_09875 [Cycloclasticus sp. symbiont of Poecilosclerida sp. M]|nr:MAG: hypothetical protein A6F71_09875 [Cycloclasticus sp. symbiont of Poecilosclerida sp. M]
MATLPGPISADVKTRTAGIDQAPRRLRGEQRSETMGDHDEDGPTQDERLAEELADAKNVAEAQSTAFNGLLRRRPLTNDKQRSVQMICNNAWKVLKFV